MQRLENAKPGFVYASKRKLLVCLSLFGILSSLYLVKWSSDLKSDLEPLLNAHRSAHSITHSWLVDNLKSQVEIIDENETNLYENLYQTLNRFHGVQHFVFNQRGKLLFSSANSELMLQQIKNEPWIWDAFGSEDLFLVESFRFLRREMVSLANLIHKDPKFLFTKTVNAQNDTLTITLSDVSELRSFAVSKAKSFLGLFAGFLFLSCSIVILIDGIRLYLLLRRTNLSAILSAKMPKLSRSKITQKALPTIPKRNTDLTQVPKNTGKAFIRVRGINDEGSWQEFDAGEAKPVKRVRTLRDLVDK
jgi:hypothetical protein